MNNKREINTYLPVFKGFYGNIYEPDETNEIDYINELRNDKKLEPINYDDCEFDYDKYYLDISRFNCSPLTFPISSYSFTKEGTIAGLASELLSSITTTALVVPLL